MCIVREHKFLLLALYCHALSRKCENAFFTLIVYYCRKSLLNRLLIITKLYCNEKNRDTVTGEVCLPLAQPTASVTMFLVGQNRTISHIEPCDGTSYHIEPYNGICYYINHAMVLFNCLFVYSFIRLFVYLFIRLFVYLLNPLIVYLIII